jgi:hypothetical protein
MKNLTIGTQFSDQRLHLRGNAYGRSSPGTHHSAVDNKPAAVIQTHQIYKRHASPAPLLRAPDRPRKTILCLT